MQLIKAVDLDLKKNYIFGYRTHGILAAGAFGSFVTNCSGFDEIFPGLTAYHLTLKSKSFYDYFIFHLVNLLPRSVHAKTWLNITP